MRFSLRIDFYGFFMALVILLIGEIYLWYVLPEMAIALRLTILVIVAFLIIILGGFLESEDQVESNKPV
jgi:hypothetical protein